MLCKKSHIIPDFMYQMLFDEKHRMNRLKVDQGKHRTAGFAQSGLHEPDLLCVPCERDNLGQLDTYASSVLYGGVPLMMSQGRSSDGVAYSEVSDLDYSQFKLFLLSILWRSSISRQRFFRNVRLGVYENVIREMLHDGKPGLPMVFPCLMVTYLNDDSFPNDIVAEPGKAKIDGGTAYKFLISGTAYLFFVTKRITPAWIEEYVVDESGRTRIIHSNAPITNLMLSDMLGIRFK